MTITYQTDVKNQSKPKNRQDKISYFYALFLIFITPLSIPIAIWTWTQDLVTVPILACAFILYCLSGLGITVGYHRLIAHRAFETKPWLRRLLMIMGTFAMQGSPASWASIHIQHHKFSDKPGDPHTPHSPKGFWYAHCGWVFHHYQPNFRRYGKWLLADKDVKHVSRYYLYYSNLGLLIPFLLGGWVGLIWGGLLRVFIVIHVTWSINSVCHMFGSRPYENTHDKSTNNFWVALFSFGEGWHNNHHRYMQRAYLGEKWYQIDFGKYLIQFLSACGLVSKIKT